MGTVLDLFRERAGLRAASPPVDAVRAVQVIPYGRAADRSLAGVVHEGRGTCSTKHALLAELIRQSWPRLRPQLLHRVYRLGPEEARHRYSAAAAAAVPAEGLVDVHRYLAIDLDGRRVLLDVTFPENPPWDGCGSMALACGPGDDIPAGTDPDVDKRALERAHCDPRVREPFIAALSRRATAGVC